MVLHGAFLHAYTTSSTAFCVLYTATCKVQTEGMKGQYPRLSDATFDRLRSDLTYTREVYEFARLKFEELSQRAREIGLNTPDGTHALHTAAREYQYFLRQYSRAVKQLACFMRSGTTQPR